MLSALRLVAKPPYYKNVDAAFVSSLWKYLLNVLRLSGLWYPRDSALAYPSSPPPSNKLHKPVHTYNRLEPVYERMSTWKGWVLQHDKAWRRCVEIHTTRFPAFIPAVRETEKVHHPQLLRLPLFSIYGTNIQHNKQEWRTLKVWSGGSNGWP